MPAVDEGVKSIGMSDDVWLSCGVMWPLGAIGRNGRFMLFDALDELSDFWRAFVPKIAGIIIGAWLKLASPLFMEEPKISGMFVFFVLLPDAISRDGCPCEAEQDEDGLAMISKKIDKGSVMLFGALIDRNFNVFS